MAWREIMARGKELGCESVSSGKENLDGEGGRKEKGMRRRGADRLGGGGEKGLDGSG